MKTHIIPIITLFASLHLCFASPAFGFYSDLGGYIKQEARGLLYGAVGIVDSNEAVTASARFMYDVDIDGWHMEYHQVWQKSFTTGLPNQTQADRLNFSYSDENFHLKLGRQAINLATTFYFSPNDFFAPFSLQTFNRDYKQGVDALYSEFLVSDLSQVSALLVNNEYESVPTSSVIRFESAFENISWMVLAGEINSPFTLKQQVIGASIQTDLFDSIGIRAEGHINRHDGQKNSEWVLGLEHRWLNELSLNLEWFNHGAGSPTSNLPYTSSKYLAIGLSYPFNPLLSGSFSVIRNMDDKSQLFTSYLNYSLSDESTLSFYALEPTGQPFVTEFGNYLSTAGLELLVYF